jgi:hypothetical protein
MRWEDANLHAVLPVAGCAVTATTTTVVANPNARNRHEAWSSRFNALNMASTNMLLSTRPTDEQNIIRPLHIVLFAAA